MNNFFTLISPNNIFLKKGNIIKYNLKYSFFKNGIKDFYFSEINKNCFKGWKLKNKQTVLVVINGKIKIILKKNNFKNKSIILNSINKKIIIIKKNISFKLINVFNSKSIVLSFLNEVY